MSLLFRCPGGFVAAQIAAEARLNCFRLTPDTGRAGRSPVPAREPPARPKEVMPMRRGFRLTVAWSAGSVTITIEPL